MNCLNATGPSVGDILSAMFPDGIPDDSPDGSPQLNQSQVEATCWEQLQLLPTKQQCAVLSQMFVMFLKQNTSIRKVPSDFLELTVQGMIHLQTCGRSNIIYLLAKALGTMRPDQSDSLLPAKRMPMGLVEYIIMFFNAKSTPQVCSFDEI